MLTATCVRFPWLAAQPGWQDIPAVKSGEVYLIDHSYFSCPGPRVVNGPGDFWPSSRIPNCFSGLIPEGVVVKLDAEAAYGLPPAEIAECFRSFR